MPSPEVVHGVLLDVFGLGTLILGESGIGKSESALELIARGHRLVADDVVEMEHVNGKLVGRSPRLTRYHMELRGVGVINVKDHFGPRSTRTAKELGLVILLDRWEDAFEVERLGLDTKTYPVLGVEIPLVRRPVAPGRNLALLIEVATRNQLLKNRGRHAARRLALRLDRLTRGKNGPRS